PPERTDSRRPRKPEDGDEPRRRRQRPDGSDSIVSRLARQSGAPEPRNQRPRRKGPRVLLGSVVAQGALPRHQQTHGREPGGARNAGEARVPPRTRQPAGAASRPHAARRAEVASLS